MFFCSFLQTEGRSKSYLQQVRYWLFITFPYFKRPELLLQLLIPFSASEYFHTHQNRSKLWIDIFRDVSVSVTRVIDFKWNQHPQKNPCFPVTNSVFCALHLPVSVPVCVRGHSASLQRETGEKIYTVSQNQLRDKATHFFPASAS